MSGGDTYVHLTGGLEARTLKAIKFNGAWIARSLIHGADERLIDHHDIGDEIELRVFEWVAKREGFV